MKTEMILLLVLGLIMMITAYYIWKPTPRPAQEIRIEYKRGGY